MSTMHSCIVDRYTVNTLECLYTSESIYASTHTHTHLPHRQLTLISPPLARGQRGHDVAHTGNTCRGGSAEVERERERERDQEMDKVTSTWPQVEE